MILFIFYQLTGQLIEILIDQPDDSVYTVSSPAIQEILTRKFVGTLDHFIEKILHQSAVFFHITNIHMLCNAIALRSNIV